jgi:beta-lactamase regulating signal transducer with metallopeptidase domain
VESLARASVEGGVLILAVWAICRLWPAAPAWARGALWWLACARLLLGLLPLAAVTLPVMPAATAVWWPSAVAATGSPDRAPAGHPRAPAALAGPAAPAGAAAGPAPPSAPGGPLDPRGLGYAVLAAWLAGVAARAAGHVRQWRRLARASRKAVPIAGDLRARLAGVLPDSVRVAASTAAPAPLVTGLLRPLVLLPASMLEGPLPDLRLAVAHEAGHVRRGDLWLAWVPALAETLFWFHPLLPLCAREYLQACEEACDARALSATGAAPYDYGRLLLVLGVQRRLGGATAIPCGSPHPRQLSRRLSMLARLGPLRPRACRAAWGLVMAVALVGLAPLRLVPTQALSAAGSPGAPPLSTETPSDAPDGAEAPGVAGARPAAPFHAPFLEEAPEGHAAEPEDLPDPSEVDPEAPDPDEEAWRDDVDWSEEDRPSRVEKRGPEPPRAPKPAEPARAVRWKPAAPVAPAPPAAARPRGYAYGWSDAGVEGVEGFSYVIVSRDAEATSGSGRAADFQEARRLGEEIEGDFLWVRLDGRRYMIEEPEWVARAHALLGPQREIGARQREVGREQSSVGREQSRIGARQSRIGRFQSEVAARQAEVARFMAERQRRRLSIRELEGMMEELAAEQERLARHQQALAEQIVPLSRRQEELGGQQEALSREMREVARRGMRELRALVEDAVRSGVARTLH